MNTLYIVLGITIYAISAYLTMVLIGFLILKNVKPHYRNIDHDKVFVVMSGICFPLSISGIIMVNVLLFLYKNLILKIKNPMDLSIKLTYKWDNYTFPKLYNSKLAAKIENKLKG